MTPEEFFEKVLPMYRSTFDISQPFLFGQKEYAAYGYFCSHTEKYVLTRSANLWKMDNYEHLFFVECDRLTLEEVKEMQETIAAEIEPQMIRKGEALPQKDHMYSYITWIFLCRNGIDQDAARLLRQYRFYKSYRFTFRGWSEARVLAIDLSQSKLYWNGRGKILVKLYRRILSPDSKRSHKHIT